MPGFTIYTSEVGVATPKKVLLKHQWTIAKLGPLQINPESPASYARDITLPRISFDEEVVEGAAVKYKFAKFLGYDDVKVTFYDTEGLVLELYGWEAKIFTPATGIGVASDYKMSSKFQLLDGQNNVLYSITLENSWPKQISLGDLTYTESDAKIVELTLSYDFISISK